MCRAQVASVAGRRRDMEVVTNSRDYDKEEEYLEDEYYGEYEEELYDYADYRCTVHTRNSMLL